MVYDTAEQILVKHNKDFKQATREVLARWKTKSGGKWEDLSKALKNTGAGGIVEELKQRMLSRKGLVYTDNSNMFKFDSYNVSPYQL